MKEINILNSVWFSPLAGPAIGIVIIDNGYEERAHIGHAAGHDQVQDEQSIAKTGAKFPLKQAKGFFYKDVQEHTIDKKLLKEELTKYYDEDLGYTKVSKSFIDSLGLDK